MIIYRTKITKKGVVIVYKYKYNIIFDDVHAVPILYFICINNKKKIIYKSIEYFLIIDRKY